MNKFLDLLLSFGKAKGCTFIRIKDYTNKQGEVQDVTINVGTSYENAKKADIETLRNLDVKTIKSESLSQELLEEARTALLEAALKPNQAMSNGQKNAYTHLFKGVKVHNETKELFIYGTKLKGTKVVKKDGAYKADTRRPLTKAKDLIRSKYLKAPNYRQYKVPMLTAVTASGDTIELNG